MKKIIEYTLVQETFEEDLATQVNRKIHEGWQPLGGVAYNVASDCDRTYEGLLSNVDINSNPVQAMVRYEEQP